MADARPENWMLALVTVQTMSAYGGQKNQGIVRMSSGTGTRTFVGICPPGGQGARFRRDSRVLLRERAKMMEIAPAFSGHLGLVWLRPWDGKSQLAPNELDIIEVCREIRLLWDGHISAVFRPSPKQRITAKELKGVTGDPWSPVQVASRRAASKKDLPAALSIRESGFPYDLASDVLFSIDGLYRQSAMQQFQNDDPDTDVEILLNAIGHHGTETRTTGYHERIIPIPKPIRSLLLTNRDDLAQLAKERVEAIGNMRREVLRPALYSLLQGGPDPDEINYASKSTSVQVDIWLNRLDQLADKTFFGGLWEEVQADEMQRHSIRVG